MLTASRITLIVLLSQLYPTGLQAFPTWAGVYGSVQRHDGQNPGTFRIMLNEDYLGLDAEVFIKIDDGSWVPHGMSYAGAVDGNSVWEATPATSFPEGARVKFYYHAYDNSDSSKHLYDSNFGQANYYVGDLIRPPYLQALTHEGVTLCWRSVGSSQVEIKLGDSPGNLTTILDKPTVDLVTEGSTHNVDITGLAPATRYYYAIYEDGTLKAGADASHFFQTAPQPGSSTAFRTWVIGDAGSGDTIQYNVRNSFKTWHGSDYVDVWLMLGDNAYFDGSESDIKYNLFDVYPALMRQSAFWPAYGNHDSHQSSAENQSGPYFENFVLPADGRAGGLASDTEAYYSFDYGNAHFICIDTSQSEVSVGSPMLTWLEQDLAQTTQAWKVAYAHHPPYSKGSHDSDVEADLILFRQLINPILEDGGVDLALYGHSHCYERSYQLRGHYGTSNTLDPSMIIDAGDGRTDGNGAYTANGQGTVYLVAGNAGKISGGSLDHPVMYHSANRPGSVVLDINGASMHVQALADDSSTFDYFTLQKDDAILWVGNTSTQLVSSPGAPTPAISLDYSPPLNSLNLNMEGLIPNASYQIQESENLVAWSQLTEFTANDTTSTWNSENNPLPSSKFYRLAYTPIIDNTPAITIESYPINSGTSGDVVYSSDGGTTWLTAELTRTGTNGNNDTWEANLGYFPPGTSIQFASVIRDAYTTELWDNNGGANHQINIP